MRDESWKGHWQKRWVYDNHFFIYSRDNENWISKTRIYVAEFTCTCLGQSVTVQYIHKQEMEVCRYEDDRLTMKSLLET